jgi:hypothetical protein
LSYILYTDELWHRHSKYAEEEGGSHDSEQDTPNSDIEFHEDDANATTFYATTDGVIVSDTSRTAAGLTTSSFRDFRIVVDGVAVDCKFPERQRRAYYELCRSQQRCSLHEHLLSRLNTTLVVGVRGRGASAPREDLVAWKTTLQSFQHLGMDVALHHPAPRRPHRRSVIKDLRTGMVMGQVRVG